ncbi:MAG: helix-turn-helix domain-containing protein [Christensenellaceae bacterium]|jgi:transcriptional regulator with XRE-family HTH domain|nr:helix-turn-helix domain-containing protein [Christensenellaceae bacterium]
MELTFAKCLKDLREIRKIGQEKLATEIGVSKGIISLWEQGKREPKLSSLLALADYFKISIDELVNRE